MFNSNKKSNIKNHVVDMSLNIYECEITCMLILTNKPKAFILAVIFQFHKIEFMNNCFNLGNGTILIIQKNTKIFTFKEKHVKILFLQLVIKYNFNKRHTIKIKINVHSGGVKMYIINPYIFSH